MRFIKFEDKELQSAFIDELNGSGSTYRLDSNGAVCFKNSDADDINNAAHRIRDAQFRWYLLKWKTDEESRRFRKILKNADIPFHIEKNETGTWFLVRRKDRQKINHIWPLVLDNAVDSSGS